MVGRSIRFVGLRLRRTILTPLARLFYLSARMSCPKRGLKKWNPDKKRTPGAKAPLTLRRLAAQMKQCP
jgi:hypothetical protein